MPLRQPTRTSYGVHTGRDLIIVELETTAGARGVAECVAMREPTYTEETVETAWHVLRDFLVGRLRGQVFHSVAHLDRFADSLLAIRGNAMARAGLEMAVWDAFAAETETPLYQLLGGQERDVPVGISLGMEDSVDALVERAQAANRAGYQRIKLKVAPGEDLLPLRALRDALPDLPLMADANSAYQDAPESTFAELDELSLMMIEQPLSPDDLVDHARLQHRIQTPICLDESIRSAADVRRAAEIGACGVINLNPAASAVLRSRAAPMIRRVRTDSGCGAAGCMRRVSVACTTSRSAVCPGFSCRRMWGRVIGILSRISSSLQYASPALVFCGWRRCVVWLSASTGGVYSGIRCTRSTLTFDEARIYNRNFAE